MGQELTVLKLGGSLLTDKTKPYVIRKDVLESAAREIKECISEGLIQSLILVHGVGSYGHPLVLEHQLHKGFQSTDQILPIAKTQAKVNEFRQIIVKQFHDIDIPMVLLHPSSMIISEKMRMTNYFLDALRSFVDLKTVPLLGGDMLIDSVMGWSVGSGDQLAVLLAKELGAKKLIFASDVSGIYDADPKKISDALPIERINLNELNATLERMGVSGVTDASGAMKGKLKSIVPVKSEIEKGLDVGLISMMTYGNLKLFLKGEEVQHTRVSVE